MKKAFVSTRSELTRRLNEYLNKGYVCYRIRTKCECNMNSFDKTQSLKANQRNGVIVIDGSTVIKLLIRCKRCVLKE